MAHNIDTSNGRDNIAFLGSRNDVWHRLGQEVEQGQSIDQWAAAAGLDWQAVKVPAFANGETIGHGVIEVPDRFFNVRSDTGHVLGYCSDRYENVQPKDVLAWFERYIAVDDRFELDVAGSLHQGEIIWATAKFNGPMTVAGDTHAARLLMSTTFDGSGSTINQATVTRVVCNNTLNAAQYDKRAVIRTRHSTKFNPGKVAKELAAVAKGFEIYKAMGDALAQVELSREQVADFFKDCLGIERTAKHDDITTRKQNQYLEIARAYVTSQGEGTGETAWGALQAITRYVDHDRSARNGDQTIEAARFASAQFGSGSQLKAQAMGLLLPLIRDRVPALAS
jgi:phage/plasmid-like protein (TIGR03299 family)